MPVKIVAPEDIPKSGRKPVKLFEKTREWKLVKAELDKGYPTGKGLIVIELTPKEMAEMHIKSERTIVRFLSEYFAKNQLSHRIKVRRRDGVSRVIIGQR